MKQLLFFLPVFFATTQYMPGQTLLQQKYVLDSVYIEGLSSKKAFKSYQVIQLSDSLSNTASFSELLQQNTAVFIKEYGKAMLSSIALRGTGATHTQIVWNGIPVNSILNGQTDLNTFSPGGFDEIYIKKGGSSVSFGSGAIGGIVLFNDKINFTKNFSLSNFTKIGSFNTGLNRFKIINSNNNSFTKLSFQTQKSTNDYPYPGYDIKNENGRYQGLDFSFTNGLKLQNHKLYLKSKLSKLDRETSRTLYMSQNAELFTKNLNFLGGWFWHTKHFTSRTEVAYINEEYRYYFSKNLPDNSHSSARTLLLKNLINLGLHKPYSIVFGSEISKQTGTGDHIGNHIRNNFAGFLIWSHQLNKFMYQLKVRQDYNPDVKIPLVGAVELSYPLRTHHHLRFTASKNFRLPTFNDLYWVPLGNRQLQPETSYSIDGGYDYKQVDFEAHVSFFLINSQNLIKWIPGDNQFWHPENFESVRYSGIEFSTRKMFKINNKISLYNKTEVNYNHAVNRKNLKLLPYTPQFTGINLLKISYKDYAMSYRYKYQGKIYTTTTNTKFLPAYHIHSLSLVYNYRQHFNIQFNINNLLNTFYENIPAHPQPGRFYELIFNFKI